MLLKDYIEKCLKDENFRTSWEEQSEEFDEISQNDRKMLTVSEALELLETDSLSSIIKNKGIKATISIPTTIEFYEKDNKCPVETFLDSIKDEKLKTKTLLNIVNLATLGNNARPPLSKYVDDGIFELRTKQSSNIDRIFYFFVFGDRIILTNGYIKKDKKLDKEEFERAKKYRNEYLRRKNK